MCVLGCWHVCVCLSLCLCVLETVCVCVCCCCCASAASVIVCRGMIDSVPIPIGPLNSIVHLESSSSSTVFLLRLWSPSPHFVSLVISLGSTFSYALERSDSWPRFARPTLHRLSSVSVPIGIASFSGSDPFLSLFSRTQRATSTSPFLLLSSPSPPSSPFHPERC